MGDESEEEPVVSGEGSPINIDGTPAPTKEAEPSPMSDSNNSDKRPILPGIVMFMCILVFAAAFIAGMQLYAQSPEASGLCFIAAALASGSLVRAILS